MLGEGAVFPYSLQTPSNSIIQTQDHPKLFAAGNIFLFVCLLPLKVLAFVLHSLLHATCNLTAKLHHILRNLDLQSSSWVSYIQKWRKATFFHVPLPTEVSFGLSSWVGAALVNNWDFWQVRIQAITYHSRAKEYVDEELFFLVTSQQS